MGWYILQTAIVFGLLFANALYQWTNSPWIGFCLSWAAAYVVTKLLSWLFLLVALLRCRIRFLPQRSFGSIHSTCLSALVTDWAMETWYHSSIA
jgi:hypothetical protein